MATLSIHCRKPGCENTAFKSVSELRYHQWSVHKDIYKNNHRNRKKKSSSRVVKQKVDKMAKVDKKGTTLETAIAALEVKLDVMNEVLAELRRMI